MRGERAGTRDQTCGLERRGAARKEGREFVRGKSKRQEGGGCEARTRSDGRREGFGIGGIGREGGKERAIGERLGSAESADVGLDQPLGAQFESDLRRSRIVSFCRAVSLSFSLSPSLFLSFPPVGTRARATVCMCVPRSPSVSPFSPATTTSSAQ